jgi:hypothetical protein
VVPFGVMVTPIKTIPSMPLLPYDPVPCKGCKSILNPYCRIDFVGKLWICPFCNQRNQFPRNYAEISENQLPAELFPSYTTVEYQLPQHGARSGPPAFLFVVDLCLSDEELQGMKDSLRQVYTRIIIIIIIIIIITVDASAYFLSRGWLQNFSPNPLPLPQSAQCDRTHCSHLTGGAGIHTPS